MEIDQIVKKKRRIEEFDFNTSLSRAHGIDFHLGKKRKASTGLSLKASHRKKARLMERSTQNSEELMEYEGLGIFLESKLLERRPPRKFKKTRPPQAGDCVSALVCPEIGADLFLAEVLSSNKAFCAEVLFTHLAFQPVSQEQPSLLHVAVEQTSVVGDRVGEKLEKMLVVQTVVLTDVAIGDGEHNGVAVEFFGAPMMMISSLFGDFKFPLGDSFSPNEADLDDFSKVHMQSPSLQSEDGMKGFFLFSLSSENRLEFKLRVLFWLDHFRFLAQSGPKLESVKTPWFLLLPKPPPTFAPGIEVSEGRFLSDLEVLAKSLTSRSEPNQFNLLFSHVFPIGLVQKFQLWVRVANNKKFSPWKSWKNPNFERPRPFNWCFCVHPLVITWSRVMSLNGKSNSEADRINQSVGRQSMEVFILISANLFSPVLRAKTIVNCPVVKNGRYRVVPIPILLNCFRAPITPSESGDELGLVVFASKTGERIPGCGMEKSCGRQTQSGIQFSCFLLKYHEKASHTYTWLPPKLTIHTTIKEDYATHPGHTLIGWNNKAGKEDYATHPGHALHYREWFSDNGLLPRWIGGFRKPRSQKNHGHYTLGAKTTGPEFTPSKATTWHSPIHSEHPIIRKNPSKRRRMEWKETEERIEEEESRNNVKQESEKNVDDRKSQPSVENKRKTEEGDRAQNKGGDSSTSNEDQISPGPVEKQARVEE